MTEEIADQNRRIEMLEAQVMQLKNALSMTIDCLEKMSIRVDRFANSGDPFIEFYYDAKPWHARELLVEDLNVLLERKRLQIESSKGVNPMEMRIATTEHITDTAKALQDMLNFYDCPMPIKSMREAEPGEVFAVVTKDYIRLSQFAEKTFTPPDGAKFYIMEL